MSLQPDEGVRGMSQAQLRIRHEYGTEGLDDSKVQPPMHVADVTEERPAEDTQQLDPGTMKLADGPIQFIHAHMRQITTLKFVSVSIGLACVVALMCLKTLVVPLGCIAAIAFTCFILLIGLSDLPPNTRPPHSSK